MASCVNQWCLRMVSPVRMVSLKPYEGTSPTSHCPPPISCLFANPLSPEKNILERPTCFCSLPNQCIFLLQFSSLWNSKSESSFSSFFLPSASGNGKCLANSRAMPKTSWLFTVILRESCCRDLPCQYAWTSKSLVVDVAVIKIRHMCIGGKKKINQSMQGAG